MIFKYGWRMLQEADPKALFKIAYNFGYKGVRSVELYKKRIKQGVHFPPFLFISVISGCNLRCQGCWVDVEAPSKHINLADTNVRDLSALEACPLLENVILPKDAAPSEGLRSHGSIRKISFREAADGSPAESAKQFWKDIPEAPKKP